MGSHSSLGHTSRGLAIAIAARGEERMKKMWTTESGLLRYRAARTWFWMWEPQTVLCVFRRGIERRANLSVDKQPRRLNLWRIPL